MAFVFLLFEKSFHLKDFVVVRGCEELQNYTLRARGMPETDLELGRQNEQTGLMNPSTICRRDQRGREPGPEGRRCITAEIIVQFQGGLNPRYFSQPVGSEAWRGW